MKSYAFEFPITGSCFIIVEAESDEEAIEKLINDHDAQTELNEWNVDWPNCFEELGFEDLMKYTTGGQEIGDEDLDVDCDDIIS